MTAMRKNIGFPAARALSAAGFMCCLLCLVCLTPSAAFAIKAEVTFYNKTDQNVFVAVCWPKFQRAEANMRIAVMWKKGWYKVQAGKSRKFKVDGLDPDDRMGFYAESAPAKGQKKLVWGGTSGNSRLIGGIHPTKAFDTGDCYIDGGKDVRFRTIMLEEKGGILTGAVNLTK
jgi:hypothetical protein